MKVEAVNQTTGERVSAEMSEKEAEALREMGKERFGGRLVDRYLDTLAISPATRSTIDGLREVSIMFEGQTLWIGRRLVEVAVALQQQFPYATFGVILGLVVSIVITAIPVLGSVLGGVVTPVAVVLGALVGGVADIQNKALYQSLSDAAARFDIRNPSWADGKDAMEQLWRVLVPEEGVVKA